MAAILQQAMDIVALEIMALASLKQEPSRASSAVGGEESNTGNLEDQAGGRGLQRVCYSDAGGLARYEVSGQGRAVLVNHLGASVAGHNS